MIRSPFLNNHTPFDELAVIVVDFPAKTIGDKQHQPRAAVLKHQRERCSRKSSCFAVILYLEQPQTWSSMHPRQLVLVP